MNLRIEDVEPGGLTPASSMVHVFLDDIPNTSVLEPLPRFRPAALGECQVAVPELVKHLARGLMRIGIF